MERLEGLLVGDGGVAPRCEYGTKLKRVVVYVCKCSMKYLYEATVEEREEEV